MKKVAQMQEGAISPGPLNSTRDNKAGGGEFQARGAPVETGGETGGGQTADTAPVHAPSRNAGAAASHSSHAAGRFPAAIDRAPGSGAVFHPQGAAPFLLPRERRHRPPTQSPPSPSATQIPARRPTRIRGCHPPPPVAPVAAPPPRDVPSPAPTFTLRRRRPSRRPLRPLGRRPRLPLAKRPRGSRNTAGPQGAGRSRTRTPADGFKSILVTTHRPHPPVTSSEALDSCDRTGHRLGGFSNRNHHRLWRTHGADPSARRKIPGTPPHAGRGTLGQRPEPRPMSNP
jgi:hypothetical protein